MRYQLVALNPEEAGHYGIGNWSLAQLEKDGVHSPYATALKKVLQKHGVQTALAPRVKDASAIIADCKTAKEQEFPLGDGIIIHRTPGPADGVFLKPGEAFLMSGAGCPIIVAQAHEYMVVAHAARDSLVERKTVEGMPVRKHVSVVEAIIEALRDELRDPHFRDIEMEMLLSIPVQSFWHSFTDAAYGSYNQKLATYIEREWPTDAVVCEDRAGMYLDLEQLFINQVIAQGMPAPRTRSSLLEHRGLAHTRDGKGTGRRNLFVIRRPLVQ